ncbi:MAG TPA: flagellar motor protein MotB, partial [Candidatus Sumerlaeota bacterium]|nr:flagellar motor protein MotB [Candidatus Sumerlaeota bacterium]
TAQARITELEAAPAAAEETAKLRAEHEQEVAALRQQLEEAHAARPDLSTDPELQALADRVRGALADAQGAQVELDRKGLRIILAGSALFAPDSVVLSNESAPLLDRVAEALSEVDGRRIRIEGHTDNTPVGDTLPFADNWGVGFARADRVREYLARRGVPAARMRAISAAEYEPRASNDTSEGRARNRRVEVVIAEPL